ncbi:hypothetical protein EJ110_NYTH30575 [Nymphaea thermarum]|nr:hypothetical protein EJ110_NYTH30575 [Nymphaea thermarum]
MARFSSSAKHSCFTRRCSRLAKEQKARLYILRRCPTITVSGGCGSYSLGGAFERSATTESSENDAIG